MESLDTVRGDYRRFLRTHHGVVLKDFLPFWAWATANYDLWVLQTTPTTTIYTTWLRFTAGRSTPETP